MVRGARPPAALASQATWQHRARLARPLGADSPLPWRSVTACERRVRGAEQLTTAAIQEFHGRVQRCVARCQDRAHEMLPSGQPSEKEVGKAQVRERKGSRGRPAPGRPAPAGGAGPWLSCPRSEGNPRRGLQPAAASHSEGPPSHAGISGAVRCRLCGRVRKAAAQAAA